MGKEGSGSGHWASERRRGPMTPPYYNETRTNTDVGRLRDSVRGRQEPCPTVLAMSAVQWLWLCHWRMRSFSWFSRPTSVYQRDFAGALMARCVGLGVRQTGSFFWISGAQSRIHPYLWFMICSHYWFRLGLLHSWLFSVTLSKLFIALSLSFSICKSVKSTI